MSQYTGNVPRPGAHMKSARLVICALLGTTASCAPAEGTATATVTDSLGVRIVQNHGDTWDPAAVPRIDESSLVRIGTVDGDPRYQLFRVSGAVRLTSGEVVVAVGGTQEVRWFDADGQWLRSVGGHGSGPGEFQGMRSLMLLPGDSLLVEDMLTDRMTLYDGEGSLVRSWTTGAAGSPSPIGRLPDGSFVAISEQSINEPPGLLKFAASLVRYEVQSPGDTDPAAVADNAATAPDTIGAFAGSESFTMPCGPNNSGLCNLGQPYGPRAIATVSGESVFAGNGATYELLRFERGRGLTAIIRRDVPPTPLGAKRVEWYHDSLVGDLQEPRRTMVLERQANVPKPATMAAYSRIVADDVDRIWLARPSPMTEPAGESDGDAAGMLMRPWDVFDVDGQFLGVVAVPRSLRITSIRDGYMVGVALDADGVEYVEVRRLINGES